MTAPEYIQLRAYARIDGLKLFAMWLVSFLCYMQGLHSPGLGLVAVILAVATPFLSYRMLRKFRDDALDGVISFRRGWLYVLFHFFYASLLFAVAQFIYFTYIDKGAFISEMTDLFSEPATLEALRQMGMSSDISNTLEAMRQMRPIDMVLNVLLSNLLAGCLLGLPVAGFAMRAAKDAVNNDNGMVLWIYQ